MIFNQFEEFGNYLWHYSITGDAMEDVLKKVLGSQDTFRGAALTTGSAGTIGCGDYLKQVFPGCKIAASEALQCPTLLENGFGAHRIEGIGDKHVPWIHNIKNTDMILAIDDDAVVQLARLFNEPAGRSYLLKAGVAENMVNKLDLLGFSGIANLLSAIKFAKYYELEPNDVVMTILTDSMDLYGSRLMEMQQTHGEYTELDAARDFGQHLMGVTTDNLQELTYESRRRVHNLKYYTWVEQQGKQHDELMDQWYDADYWTGIQRQIPEIDALIEAFNDRVDGISPG